MKEKNIRKLTIAGVLVAVAVVGSLFSIPVLGAKCSPVQHMVNVLGAVLLGPGYAVGMAFAAVTLNLLCRSWRYDVQLQYNHRRGRLYTFRRREATNFYCQSDS